MKTKIKTLVVCTVLAVGAFKAFSQDQVLPVEQTASCDASNSNKCVIYNVGEGTGKLSVEKAN